MIHVLLLQTQCPCSGGQSRPLLWFGMFAVAWLLATWIGPRFHKKGSAAIKTMWKVVLVVALVAAIVVVVVLKERNKETGHPATDDTPAGVAPPADGSVGASHTTEPSKALPRLLDLGSDECLPCKQMVPLLAELKTEYADRLQVDFIDVWKNPAAGKEYDVKVIPTQIFYDASGQERFRHVGFISKKEILAKWKELGIDLSSAGSDAPTFERLTPAQVDNRPQESICYMCDGDVTAQTLVTVATDKGPVWLCGPHCYFIMHSCLTEDKTDFDKKVTFTDWATGNPVAAAKAIFLYGQDETTGRPWTKAFADRNEALQERTTSGGNILTLPALQQKEMSHRCGFCERACYPQDAAEVLVADGMRTWGCCSHCALGVAARTGKDIEVHEKDRLTRQPVVVKTFEGKIASLEPPAAVAWFGQRQKPDGTWGSAGCFHQGFFANADNLKKWVEKNPCETGKLISISQALANKMKLTPEQIQKACKIGECSPQ